MTLQEAIEINQSLLDGTYDHRDEKMETALKLLIEAGKRCQYNYLNPQRPDFRLLPGEIKD